MASGTENVENNTGISEDSLPDEIKGKVSDGKINTKVRCERCSSLVVSPGMAKYVEKKVGFRTRSRLKSKHHNHIEFGYHT